MSSKQIATLSEKAKDELVAELQARIILAERVLEPMTVEAEAKTALYASLLAGSTFLVEEMHEKHRNAVVAK